MTLSAMENLVRNSSFAASSPPRQSTSRPGPGVTCTHKVREIHTDTVSSTPITVVANANWENARESEGLYLYQGQVEAGCGQL